MKFDNLFLFLLIAALAAVVLAEDFYKLLDVSRDATVADIRRKFKKLALKLHPDKNKVNIRFANSCFFSLPILSLVISTSWRFPSVSKYISSNCNQFIGGINNAMA